MKSRDKQTPPFCHRADGQFKLLCFRAGGINARWERHPFYTPTRSDCQGAFDGTTAATPVRRFFLLRAKTPRLLVSDSATPKWGLRSTDTGM